MRALRPDKSLLASRMAPLRRAAGGRGALIVSAKLPIVVRGAVPHLPGARVSVRRRGRSAASSRQERA